MHQTPSLLRRRDLANPIFRRPTAALLAAALALTPALPAPAQDAGPADAERAADADPQDGPTEPTQADIRVPESPVVDEGLIMNFDKASLTTVLDYLAEKKGLILVNQIEDFQGTISIRNSTPMSLDEIVTVINTVLFEEEYTAVLRGNILKVVALDEAKSESIPVTKGKDPALIPVTDTIVTHVIPISFANADEIQDDLEDLINDDYAEMTANESSNSIIITDTQANIRRIVTIIAALDQAVEKVTEVKVFKLEFADADDTARLIESTFQQSLSEDEVFGRMISQRFGGGGGGRGGRGGRGDDDGGGGGMAQTAVSAEADTRTNSVVVSASPEVMLKIAEIIEEMDSDTTAKDSVLIYHVKNMQATDLADIFNSLFEEQVSGNTNNNQQRFGGGGGGGRVQAANAVSATGNTGAADLVGQVNAVANEASNTILILTPEKNFARVQEILDEMDKPVPQVLIRVLVSEVTYDDSIDFGVEFEGINVGSTTNDNILTDFDLFDSTLGLNYLMFDGDNFRLAVRALAATGRFDVLSRPYLLTNDNQEAMINVGQRVPILTNSRVDESGDIISTIDYEDIGIILTVTPQINSEGLVVMDVSQIISSIADQAIPVAPDQNAVVFNQRELTTQVAVGHGQTVVIGGLVQDQLTETIRKVPILGDIPILGNLFKRTERSKVKTELLLFLTPEVIETPDQLTPAADKIKAESETLKNAIEPGRLEEHLEKLKATPGNEGPKPPIDGSLDDVFGGPDDEPGQPDAMDPGPVEGEPDRDLEDPEPGAGDADDLSRNEQRDLLITRLEQWNPGGGN